MSGVSINEEYGDRLLIAGEIAAILALPESWVREHTRLNDIPHIRLGRYVRYRLGSVISWVAENERGGATLQSLRRNAHSREMA